eukprot:403354579
MENLQTKLEGRYFKNSPGTPNTKEAQNHQQAQQIFLMNQNQFYQSGIPPGPFGYPYQNVAHQKNAQMMPYGYSAMPFVAYPLHYHGHHAHNQYQQQMTQDQWFQQQQQYQQQIGMQQTQFSQQQSHHQQQLNQSFNQQNATQFNGQAQYQPYTPTKPNSSQEQERIEFLNRLTLNQQQIEQKLQQIQMHNHQDHNQINGKITGGVQKHGLIVKNVQGRKLSVNQQNFKQKKHLYHELTSPLPQFLMTKGRKNSDLEYSQTTLKNDYPDLMSEMKKSLHLDDKDSSSSSNSSKKSKSSKGSKSRSNSSKKSKIKEKLWIKKKYKQTFHRHLYPYIAKNGDVKMALIIASLLCKKKRLNINEDSVKEASRMQKTNEIPSMRTVSPSSFYQNKTKKQDTVKISTITYGASQKNQKVVEFEGYDANSGKMIFMVKMDVGKFGFTKDYEDLTSIEIFNRVKNLLSKIHLNKKRHKLAKQLEDELEKFAKPQFKKEDVKYHEKKIKSRSVEKKVKLDKKDKKIKKKLKKEYLIKPKFWYDDFNIPQEDKITKKKKFKISASSSSSSSSKSSRSGSKSSKSSRKSSKSSKKHSLKDKSGYTYDGMDKSNSDFKRNHVGFSPPQQQLQEQNYQVWGGGQTKPALNPAKNLNNDIISTINQKQQATLPITLQNNLNVQSQQPTSVSQVSQFNPFTQNQAVNPTITELKQPPIIQQQNFSNLEIKQKQSTGLSAQPEKMKLQQQVIDKKDSSSSEEEDDEVMNKFMKQVAGMKEEEESGSDNEDYSDDDFDKEDKNKKKTYEKEKKQEKKKDSSSSSDDDKDYQDDQIEDDFDEEFIDDEIDEEI